MYVSYKQTVSNNKKPVIFWPMNGLSISGVKFPQFKTLFLSFLTQRKSVEFKCGETFSFTCLHQSFLIYIFFVL